MRLLDARPGLCVGEKKQAAHDAFIEQLCNIDTALAQQLAKADSGYGDDDATCRMSQRRQPRVDSRSSNGPSPRMRPPMLWW